MSDKKAILVIIKNPFQPWNGRVVKHVEAGKMLSHVLLDNAIVGCNIRTVVDGVVYDNDYKILGGEIITLSPVVEKGGKNILGIIAAIAVSVLAAGVGAWAGGATTGLFGASTGAAMGVWGYVAAAAVMFIGSTLVNRVMGQPSLGKFDSYENEATYSWNGVQTMEGQTNAIALTYGKVKSGGQSIAKYVSVEDNKETLNWLVACGEGELEITNVKINDNEIDYYKDVVCETRSGTNNQEIIPNFNDTYFTKNLGYQILDDPVTDICQGDATEGIIVKLECSQGLYYANDKGNLTEAWIDVNVEFRLQGDSTWQPYSVKRDIVGGANGISVANENTPIGTYAFSVSLIGWGDDGIAKSVKITYPNGDVKTCTVYNRNETIGYFKISNDIEDGAYNIKVDDVPAPYRIKGSKSSAIRNEYRKDNLPPGIYEVRCNVEGRSHDVTNSRASTRIWWSSLTSIVYDDFTYPNIALIGIKALATDQLSGSPNLTFLKERKFIWAFNPYTDKYEQKPANNPAWACYDMVHQCNRLYNVNTGQYEYEVRGAYAKMMMYDQFNEWAKFCEEKELFVNIEINQCGEMLEIVNNKIAPIGRGVVVRFGTKYGCVWNCSKSPVQMFGMGNIIADSFKEDFLPVADRANCVEVTFTNAEHDYERETITIFTKEYDNDPEAKTAQATFDGITSYKQAYREGMYQLYSNKYQLRTVTFEANIDAIACTVGDVIMVAHDVPKWGYSGRIFDVDIENNALRLPVEIQNGDGKYRIMYRTVNDNLYTSDITIIENENGWCTVKCSAKFTENDLPNKNDIFDIALVDVGSKPFIVKSITRAQDFTREIACIEYAEALYNEDYTIPVIDYSDQTNNKTPNVTNLQVVCNDYLTENGIYMYQLNASWECEKPCRYSVYFSSNGTDWNMVQADLSVMEYSEDTKNPPKYVKVVSTYNNVISSGTIALVDMISFVKLPKVVNLKAYADYIDVDENIECDVYLTWDKPSQFGEYVTAQIYYKNRDDWELLGQGYTSYTYADVPLGRTYNIAVCVVDTNGHVQIPDEAEQITITIKDKIVEEEGGEENA